MAAKVKWNQRAIETRLKKAILEATIEGAEMIEAEGNRRILSPPKTGRIYNKGGSFHQASAPGEAPANFTGKLVRSSHVSVNRSKLSATVTWRALYADMLEAGTENMEPRPFARPAAAKLQKTIQRNIDRAIKTEMKRK